MEVVEVSKVLGVDEKELVKRGVKAYLEMELRSVNAEIATICLKYGVKSLKELDEKINRGELNETETFEDFTRLDYLEDRREKIKELLRKMA